MDFLVTLRWRLAVTLVETAEFVVFEGEEVCLRVFRSGQLQAPRLRSNFGK